MWCVVLTCSFCQVDMQAGLEHVAVAGEMVLTFLTAVWHGDAFHMLAVQGVTEFDSG
jgi:hypothetical protein